MVRDAPSPKRGAVATPKDVLESATPYEPPSDVPNEPDAEADSAESPSRPDPGIGETIVSDTQANMGIPGTPPPPPSDAAAGSQSGDGSTKGTPGTPPPPSTSAGGGQQGGAGGVGTEGTPPPPPSGSTTADKPSSSGVGMGTPGTPPPPA